MRLVLLTVEGKGLRLEIQKKATSGARDHGEIAERGKKTHKDKKRRNKKKEEEKKTTPGSGEK